MISIAGLDKAEVLKALYDSSHIQGLGFLQEVPAGYVTVEHCRMLLETTGYPYFDYLYGRVLKVDLSGDEFDERLYDRDNGPGAAARAVNIVRKNVRKHRVGFLNVDTSRLDIQFDPVCREHPGFALRFNGIEALEQFIYMCESLKHDMERGV